MSIKTRHPRVNSSKGLFFKTHKKEVVASRGVVVANHPLASSAGVEMLARGGNAFDAAVASLFALTVVEPMMVSMFGAGFFVFRDGKTGRIETLDNYAVAPKVATEDMFMPVEKRKPGQYLFETVGRENMVGHLSVATPGALKGWERMVEEHGSLSLSEVMAPAIRLARRGYRASRDMAHLVKMSKQDLERFPETAKIFLPGGKPLEQGQLVLMPEYAETLEKVSKIGSDVLHRGELGRVVVDDMEENGGILTMEDLAKYEVILREPVVGTYRDRYQIYSMAPGSSGGTHIIQMLNMLERFDVTSLGFGSVEHIHLFAEVLKIAFADRQHYLGDPAMVEVPIEGLSSKAYAEERVKEIGGTAKTYSPGKPDVLVGEGGNTTHVSAMDSDGNIVSATQTLFSGFGSKVTTPGTGMLLNNCMGLFDPRPGRANSVAGGKRMLSSMAPTIALRDGSPFMCIGTPGGTRIFPSVCSALVNVIDFGMTIQQAVEAPRVWTMGILGTPEERLYVEPEFPEEILEGLRSKGHEIAVVPKIAGGMNGVLMDSRTDLMHGGACWRADGTPMGVSGGWAHPKGFEEAPIA
ncbi:MAG: gamma-glutamyltransferase [Candidatus Bathyarchaeia archaeon]